MLGLYLEEIEVGRRFALGHYKFTRESVLSYSRQFNPAGFHVDDAVAATSPYGAIIAAGPHTASGWMACFVSSNTHAREALAKQGKALPDLGPSPGFKNMKWLKPVYVGDVVSYFVTATECRALKSRPGWGMVSSYGEGVNQNSESVLTFEGAVLTQCKPDHFS
jgi:acyl dehydratase